MSEDLRPLTVETVLDAISSERPSSGAGVAAGMALALGIACAQKAIAVTLKHRDDVQLSSAADRLRTLRGRSLEQARLDAALFERYLRSKDPQDVDKLVAAAEQFQHLARETAREFAALEGKVIDSVIGDLTAADALQRAATTIEDDILRDNQREQARA
ncbi:MAG: cyclodeaminase/cyclohydrolase family protein, partial [Steroidobacteraceae bacterium]